MNKEEFDQAIEVGWLVRGSDDRGEFTGRPARWIEGDPPTIMITLTRVEGRVYSAEDVSVGEVP